MKENIVIYVSKDGKIKVNTNIENENIWMTQQCIAELFDVEQLAVAKHLINIYNEEELNKDSTNSKMELVQNMNGVKMNIRRVIKVVKNN